MSFFYVYILQSELVTRHFYVGRTEDLRARLKKHNADEVPHTAKFRPWQIKTVIAFNEEKRAVEFEHYLKTASGRAFAKRRL
ncbi:MAG TPA: GIY-YIG nuclease family protein [Verrucomicrobiae bacterium]|jgi:predicted GIY-YIG superfamily endonuclease